MSTPAPRFSGPIESVSLAEVLGAFSHALDMTEGQPEGHCVRVCWIGMHIGREIGLPENQLWELYYTLLLKDLGCSSNAARICQLYLADDLKFKRDFKTMDSGVTEALSFVLSHTGLQAGLAERFKAIANIIAHGGEISRELIETRCQRGAQIARQLRFSEAVAEGVQNLDEHWNGGGKPLGLSRQEIPIYSRIALLAQVIDVFHTSAGRQAAIDEARKRAGQWFDPELVGAFLFVADRASFWEGLAAPDLQQRVFRLEPARHVIPLDDDYLDDIAAAFGQVVDAKSPFTSGHSARVGLYADLIGARLNVPLERRRWIKRGALLHDVGKLGVSNSILDKPGKLEGEELIAIQRHALHTETILSRIAAFSELARVAGAHHERLDGKGYPHQLRADEITFETRIISVADFFDALTADRPYRAAMSIDNALGVMAKTVGSAIDPIVFEALQGALDDLPTADAEAA